MGIRRLPPLLVNQIAAGEVIERPASVVKELVENAIDAGAGRVRIEIEEGGRALVRVVDDGAGIDAEELPLAVAPHATSKVAEAGDLVEIATLGFRGEALASIASISRFTLLSRTAAATGATQIEGEGDALSAPRPAAGPPGTSVTVRNLFFNTPARRKFLKTDQTETGRIAEAVSSLAIAHPSVAFTLVVDGRTRRELPAESDPRRRVVAVLGAELEPELLEVRGESGGEGAAPVRVWGLVGRPGLARPTAKHLRTFVNGRAIVDRSLVHAVREGYRGLLDPTRTPTAALFIEMDPSEVDVNVHPAKAEVRFRHPRLVHGVVHAAVQEALRAADLTPSVDLRGAPPGTSSFSPSREFGRGGAFPTGTVVETLRRLDPREKGLVYRELKASLAAEAPEQLERRDAEAADPGLAGVRPVRDVLQVHRSYIVTEDDDGMLIIDQHALHERVMFEQLRERVERGPLESQRMLLPATLELDAAQRDALESLGPLLVRLGIEVEAMGPSAVGVHAFTSLLFARGVEPVEFLTELLARAVDEGLPAGPEAMLHEVLDMMACKAAIKAGDRLEPREIEDLLRRRDEVERSSNCPHGRPTTLRLTLRDLERQFGRR